MSLLVASAGGTRAHRTHGAGMLGWAAGTAALLLLVAGGSAALEQLRSGEWFPLQMVRLDSPVRHLAPGDVEVALEPYLDRGMFGLDVTGMRQAVEALPWVASASVRRVWPDMVELTVREHRPLAHWGDSALVTGAGEVFEPDPDSIPDGLPRLSGVPGQEEAVVGAYRELGRRFKAAGFELRALAKDARAAWRGELVAQGGAGAGGDGRIRLELGRDQVEQRVERFLEAWPLIARDQAPERRLASADLRYPNGFALDWRDADMTTE